MTQPDHRTEEERLDEIAQRVGESLAMIRKGITYVPKDGKLTIQLNFEDEIDLAEQWMIVLADCKFLLEKTGRTVS